MKSRGNLIALHVHRTVIIAVCLIMPTTSFLNLSNCGSITLLPSPAFIYINSKLYIEEGSNLHFTCSRNSSFEFKDSGWVQCIKRGNNLFCNTTRISSNDFTFDLHVMKDHTGTFGCYWSENCMSNLSKDILHVLRRPKKPVLDHCEFINFHNLTCHWKPNFTEQLTHTYINNKHNSFFFNQIFYWQLESENDNWHAYNVSNSNVVNGSYIWNKDSKIEEIVGKRGCVKIVANNPLNYSVSSDVSCFNLTDIAMVRSSLHMSLNSTDPYVLEIRWQPPSVQLPSDINLTSFWIYKITINQIKSTVTESTNKTFFMFQSHPWTEYNVTVQVKLSASHLWSAAEKRQIRTRQSVPCRQPIVMFNAFHRSLSSNTTHLYWKAISKEDNCGSGLQYEVSSTAKNVSGSTSFTNISIPLDSEDNTVEIYSRNDLGRCSKPPHHLLLIPSHSYVSHIIQEHKVVVEGDRNNATVHWNFGDISDIEGYTLFWCKGIRAVCEEEINWKELAASSSEHDMTFHEHFEHFLVGVAVNMGGGVSTGIVWAQCYLQATLTAEPPSQVIAKPVDKCGQLKVSWTPLSCSPGSGSSGKPGYAQNYIIHYCTANHRDRCTSAVQNQTVSNDVNFSYLRNLHSGVKYLVWMSSRTRSGSSRPSNVVHVEVTGTCLSTAAICGIGIVAALIFIVVSIGLLTNVRKLSLILWKWTANGFQVQVPEKRTLSTSSEPTDVGLLANTRDEEFNASQNGILNNNSFELLQTPQPTPSPSDYVPESLFNLSSSDSSDLLKTSRGSSEDGGVVSDYVDYDDGHFSQRTSMGQILYIEHPSPDVDAANDRNYSSPLWSQDSGYLDIEFCNRSPSSDDADPPVFDNFEVVGERSSFMQEPTIELNRESGKILGDILGSGGKPGENKLQTCVELNVTNYITLPEVLGSN